MHFNIELCCCARVLSTDCQLLGVGAMAASSRLCGIGTFPFADSAIVASIFGVTGFCRRTIEDMFDLWSALNGLIYAEVLSRIVRSIDKIDCLFTYAVTNDGIPKCTKKKYDHVQED